MPKELANGKPTTRRYSDEEKAAAEAHHLADLARARDVTVMVGHTHRYLTGLRGLLDDVAGGRRRFESVLARYLLLRRDRVGSSGYVRSWTDDLLWHHMNHSTDIALGLLGVQDASQVGVQVAHGALDPESGKPLDITVTITTGDGRVGTVVGSYNKETEQVYDYYLAGAGATVFVEQNILRDRGGTFYVPDDNPQDEEDRVLQDREFFAAVREGRPAAISPDSVLPTMDILQRAQELIRCSEHPNQPNQLSLESGPSQWTSSPRSRTSRSTRRTATTSTRGCPAGRSRPRSRGRSSVPWSPTTRARRRCAR